MFLFSCRVPLKYCIVYLLFSLVANFAWAQSETATVSGQVVDSSGLRVAGAQVKLVDIDRDISVGVTTNSAGLYVFPSVRPGRYRMEVVAAGFKLVNVTDITVNVQDHLEQNFKLVVGSISESITVESGTPLVETESATVSTVVDRQFAENLPLNGRSFQTLIELTPGVVLTPTSVIDSGQFSVDGQRASSNYWMVDGVSANIGSSSGANPGNGMGGTVGSFSAVGGTNSLVSVDALQEFRIQTSTFAPEFGRTPGAQISIVTRSGTNEWHGTLFDYLRNDVLDANDWFADENDLPKPKERQNDFGGTFNGPIVKDRTFFFFSYEGLRLRLPQVTLTDVPCDSTCTLFGNARAMAVPAMQPFLNAFPLPNGPEILDMGNATGAAQFNASYSNPASLDAYSIRIDERARGTLNVFGRYNYSPSQFTIRGGANGTYALSGIQPSKITTQTGTIGATLTISPMLLNDLRFNYSRIDGSSNAQLDNFGGAVPLPSLPLPSPYTSENGFLFLRIASLGTGSQETGSSLDEGHISRNRQKQFNLVDNLSVQKGTHRLKFGVDFRRLSPEYIPPAYSQWPEFDDVASTEQGNLGLGGAEVYAANTGTFLFRNLSAFAQDTWRAASRLTLTYGLRWDLDFPPESLSGPSIPAVTGYSLTNLSELAIAPAGTPPFKMTYGNLAPRLGLAYSINQNQGRETVLRGGFGVFYDLVSSETGNLVGNQYPPFGAVNFVPNGATFPLSVALSAPPSIPATGTLAEPYFFNPGLKEPYTLEWNVSFEQALGRNQTLSASYVGAAGRRLLQTTSLYLPPSNPNIGFGFFIDNTATSDYSALQLQFRRSLSQGLQALASYSWAHSIDNGSAGSTGLNSNDGIPGNPNANRGNSDFDIRNAFSMALTYDVPAPTLNELASAVLRGWSLQSIVEARSAAPVYVSDTNFFFFESNIIGDVRPDLVPGKPLYLTGSQCLQAPPQGFGQLCPGGKGLDPAAFTNPPSAPIGPDCPFGGCPLRQGTTPRNFLRGFGATQWDLAIHRDFRVHDSVKLQFRAEMFNALNHPNFGPPNGNFGTNSFGLSSQMLGQSLSGAGSLGSGGLSPLYQIGGPRSIQLALKLQF